MQFHCSYFTPDSFAMKNYLVLPIFCLLTISSALSQFVDGIPIEEIKADYIQIYPREMGGRKITINLDYGQLKIPGDAGDQRIKDKDGKPLHFNSIIHAINFMKDFGYELFEVYSFGSGDTVAPYYILRKKPHLSLLDE